MPPPPASHHRKVARRGPRTRERLRCGQRRPGIRRHIKVPGTTSPRERRPGCPRRPQPEPPSGGHPQMLRLQQPLDERYAHADPEDLERRIAAANATLGDRPFILGPHYQRDEVIRWVDARGDSYRLRSEEHTSELQSLMRISYAVFCL